MPQGVATHAEGAQRPWHPVCARQLPTTYGSHASLWMTGDGIPSKI